MDTSPLLEPDKESCYMSINGIMRWVVELGRVDIATEISQLPSFMAMPRKGSLVNALHVMSYLRKALGAGANVQDQRSGPYV